MPVCVFLWPAEAVEIGIDDQIAFTLRDAVEQDGHGVLDRVADVVFLIGPQPLLRIAQCHAV